MDNIEIFGINYFQKFIGKHIYASFIGEKVKCISSEYKYLVTGFCIQKNTVVCMTERKYMESNFDLRYYDIRMCDDEGNV